MQLLWTMLNSLQIIVHLPLVFVRYPMNALRVSQVFLRLAQFDFLPHEYYNPLIFNFDPRGEEKQAERYISCSYETFNFILNSGSFFWIFAAYPFLSLLFLIMNRSSDNRYVLKVKRFFTAIFFYEFLVRLWLESYFEVVLSAVLNFRLLLWTPEGELIAAVAALGSGLLALASLPLAFLVLRRRENLRLVHKARTLIEDLDVKRGASQRLYFFFFLLRRFLVGAVITLTPTMALP